MSKISMEHQFVLQLGKIPTPTNKRKKSYAYFVVKHADVPGQGDKYK